MKRQVCSLIIMIVLFIGCKKEDGPSLGVIDLSSINTNNFEPSFKIDIRSDGNSNIIEKGICYSTSSQPTISNNKVQSTDASLSQNLKIHNIIASCTYYVRAYVTNSIGTSYSNEISFTSPQQGSFSADLKITIIDSTTIQYDITINDRAGWNIEFSDTRLNLAPSPIYITPYNPSLFIKLKLNNNINKYTGVISHLQPNLKYESSLSIFNQTNNYTSHPLTFWTKHTIGEWELFFTSLTNNDNLIFSSGDNVFVGFGSKDYNYTNVFFKLSKSENETYNLNEKLTAPFTPRANMISFSIEGLAYFIGGTGYNKYYNEVWQFDYTKNEWKQLKNANIDLNVLYAFGYGDKGYVIASGGNIYEYNPKIDEWLLINKTPNNYGSIHTIPFNNGTTVYYLTYSRDDYGVVTYNFFSTDILNNSYKKCNFIKLDKGDAIQASFSINQYGYLGLKRAFKLSNSEYDNIYKIKLIKYNFKNDIWEDATDICIGPMFYNHLSLNGKAYLISNDGYSHNIFGLTYTEK